MIDKDTIIHHDTGLTIGELLHAIGVGLLLAPIALASIWLLLAIG
jgi:hypothetical protein